MMMMILLRPSLRLSFSLRHPVARCSAGMATCGERVMGLQRSRTMRPPRPTRARQAPPLRRGGKPKLGSAATSSGSAKSISTLGASGGGRYGGAGPLERAEAAERSSRWWRWWCFCRLWRCAAWAAATASGEAFAMATEPSGRRWISRTGAPPAPPPFAASVAVRSRSCGSSYSRLRVLSALYASASICSWSWRGSCRSLTWSACASVSHCTRSRFFFSRLSVTSRSWRAASRFCRSAVILSKAAMSFSRRRRVCGRFTFSRVRNTWNGSVSLDAGGTCSMRMMGLPHRFRFATQYSYTACSTASRVDASRIASYAISRDSVDVDAAACTFSACDKTPPLSAYIDRRSARARSVASSHAVSSRHNISSNFSGGKRFCPSLYDLSQSSSSLSRSYCTKSLLCEERLRM
mmetsp:Transcript_12554/g.41389  ORF Transcript_12554/g.41389 Transcript_12554/m.41389 type:complete len:407 (-) Transcript_12554:432-1652(-)